MCELYRTAARRVGTDEAFTLAEELCAWESRMWSHQRTLARAGLPANHCAHSDECAHGLARELWPRARAVLGAHACEFAFLRRAAGH